MQSTSYEEAREWFWVRTAIWCVPMAIISVIASFAYFGPLLDDFRSRLTLALAAGIGSMLFGVLAAWISIQFPWMRLGWRRAWLPNGILCAVMAAIGAVLVCSVFVSAMRDNIYNPASEEVQAAAYDMMLFAISLAAAWGLVLGGWFALRLDKYFIEPI